MEVYSQTSKTGKAAHDDTAGVEFWAAKRRENRSVSLVVRNRMQVLRDRDHPAAIDFDFQYHPHKSRRANHADVMVSMYAEKSGNLRGERDSGQ